MVTVRDLTQTEQMQTLRLIAGKNGLDREVRQVGILDYEFTKVGTLPGDNWAGEFVLTSFLYTSETPDNVLSAIKRLIRMNAAGLAIRNVFRIEISPDVISYANHYNFPIFIIEDRQLFFQDVILCFHELKTRLESWEYQERILMDILSRRIEAQDMKKSVLEIDPYFSSTYCVCYIKPVNELGKANLSHLLRQGISRKLHREGKALIPYREGAFFVHSVDQSKAVDSHYAFWHEELELEPSRYLVGISETKPSLSAFRVALMESYYSCFCAKLLEIPQAQFTDLGIYQVLFQSLHGHWLEGYLNRITRPIIDYDAKNKGELWNTLVCFEKHNGSYKETAAEMFGHENTIRYRIKKIFELFDKDSSDTCFQAELLTAVKLFHIQELFYGNQDLFLSE